VRRASALTLLLLTLSACAPKSETAAPAAMALDCQMDFAAQSARIVAQPNLTPAQHAPGEPYNFYSTNDGHASYLITEPGAPGHPAIMMQTAGARNGRDSGVKTTGCAYGNKRGYQQLANYLDSLKTWTRR
jgi:hypothetical protein